MIPSALHEHIATLVAAVDVCADSAWSHSESLTARAVEHIVPLTEHEANVIATAVARLANAHHELNEAYNLLLSLTPNAR